VKLLIMEEMALEKAEESVILTMAKTALGKAIK
jgi:hypothetical protein